MCCRNSDNDTGTSRNSDIPSFEIQTEDMDNPPYRALQRTLKMIPKWKWYWAERPSIGNICDRFFVSLTHLPIVGSKSCPIGPKPPSAQPPARSWTAQYNGGTKRCSRRCSGFQDRRGTVWARKARLFSGIRGVFVVSSWRVFATRERFVYNSWDWNWNGKVHARNGECAHGLACAYYCEWSTDGNVREVPEDRARGRYPAVSSRGDRYV